MANVHAVMNVPLDVFPVADYVAVLDPNDPKGVRHVELYSQFIAVPLGADSIDLVVHRLNFPDTPSLVLKCRAELSLDGGITWSPKPSGENTWPWGNFPIAFTTAGGILKDKLGRLILTSGILVPLPEPDNPLRIIRITFIPLESVTAKISVMVMEAGK